MKWGCCRKVVEKLVKRFSTDLVSSRVSWSWLLSLVKELVKSICPSRELYPVWIHLDVNFLFSIFCLFFGVSGFLIRVEIFYYFPRTRLKYRRRVRFSPRDGRRWPRQVGALWGCSIFPSPEKAKIENRFNCWLRWKLQQTGQNRGFAPVVLESKTGRELKACTLCLFVTA